MRVFFFLFFRRAPFFDDSKVESRRFMRCTSHLLGPRHPGGSSKERKKFPRILIIVFESSIIQGFDGQVKKIPADYDLLHKIFDKVKHSHLCIAFLIHFEENCHFYLIRLLWQNWPNLTFNQGASI